ncbi:hypothetical protein [Empedobacter brevis]|uniref:hypothetical protein n=1 Tax=Empedobacter brevis TaxID=247 RepID=UPI0023F0C47D|nr:hypothetical protein [Empedobacter brevis]
MSYDENRISDLIDGGIQHKNELIASLREKSIIKGFIEVSASDQYEKELIAVSSILRVLNTSPVLIITSDLVSRYECSGDNFELYVKESYEEIKQLIKQATEL